MSNRWGVEISGEDVSIWAKILKSPFDPYIEEIENEGRNYLVLRSSSFDQAADASEIRAIAKGLIDVVNVAVTNNVGADPVALGSVVEFVAGGPPRRVHFLEAEPIRIRLRAGPAELTLKDAQGNEVPAPPKPSVVQEWIRAAVLEPEIGHALKYLAGNPGWFELYKAYEALKRLPRGGIPKREIDRFTQTANVGNRHHYKGWKPHKNPMQLWEARALVVQWISAAISDVLAKNP